MADFSNCRFPQREWMVYQALVKAFVKADGFLPKLQLIIAFAWEYCITDKATVCDTSRIFRFAV
jgi:hypothetical protein